MKIGSKYVYQFNEYIYEVITDFNDHVFNFDPGDVCDWVEEIENGDKVIMELIRASSPTDLHFFNMIDFNTFEKRGFSENDPVLRLYVDKKTNDIMWVKPHLPFAVYQGVYGKESGTLEGCASICPVCGSPGDDLVFRFYCSNKGCQNYG